MAVADICITGAVRQTLMIIYSIFQKGALIKLDLFLYTWCMACSAQVTCCAWAMLVQLQQGRHNSDLRSKLRQRVRYLSREVLCDMVITYSALLIHTPLICYDVLCCHFVIIYIHQTFIDVQLLHHDDEVYIYIS